VGRKTHQVALDKIMTSDLITLIRTTLITLRVQAAASTSVMADDLVVILREQELDGILNKLVGWVDELDGKHVEGSNANNQR
jgi:hypothetical protein